MKKLTFLILYFEANFKKRNAKSRFFKAIISRLKLKDGYREIYLVQQKVFNNIHIIKFKKKCSLKSGCMNDQMTVCLRYNNCKACY